MTSSDPACCGGCCHVSSQPLPYDFNHVRAGERAEAALRADAEEKRRRFEAAVEKGNWASLALKPVVRTTRVLLPIIALAVPLRSWSCDVCWVPAGLCVT